VLLTTGPAFIQGTFSNLAQGQAVGLNYNGTTYQFVANYYGGSGNDLVLQWANNKIYAWGSNGNGQLGNNSTTSSSVPASVTQSGVLAGKTLISVAVGYEHSLALCSDGTLAAWGYNYFGQLGNNSTTQSNVPVLVSQSGVLAGKTVVSIVAGYYHSMALCSDGTVAAWGYNVDGQLGNSSTTNSSVPVLVTQSGVLAGKTVVSMAAGIYHSVALCSDGTVAAWGYNYEGELGNNSTTNSSVPVLVTQSGVLAGKAVVSIAAGGDHNFALCSDGTVAAWGYNYDGELGYNSTTYQSNVPVLVTQSGVLGGKTVVSLSAGMYHSLALCSDGTVAAWGDNNVWQLGNNSSTNSKVPVLVTQNGVLAGKTVVSIVAGHFHSLALCSDGTVAAWGYNADGQLGNNSTTSSSVPVLVSTSSLGSGEKFAALAAGPTADGHCVALTAVPCLPTPTIFADGFEGATLDPFWTKYESNGSITLQSSVPAHSGSQAVQFSTTNSEQKNNSLTHVFAQPQYGSISVWVRDQLDSIFFSVHMINTALSQDMSLGVQDWDQGAYYCNGGRTSVARSIGWHQFTFQFTAGVLTETIDGQMVYTGAGGTQFDKVILVMSGTGSGGVSFDDFLFEAASQLGVEQPAGTATASGDSRNFNICVVGEPLTFTFTVKNTGQGVLSGLGVTFGGTNAADFSLVSPIASQVLAGGSTPLNLRFSPSSGGTKSATMHLSSNDPDHNPFDIQLAGTALSPNDDTDGDGMNDVAEYKLAALGFDWQVSQPALVAAYFASANVNGLYTRDQVQALQVGTPLLAKDPTSGLFKLTIGVQKSTDLLHFNPFPLTAPQASINANGQLEFQFSSQDNAAFFRLLAE